MRGSSRAAARTGRERLPHLAAALKKLKLEGSWLDGEIVVLREDGRASFQALQNAFEAGRDTEIVYYVFDAPFLEGRGPARAAARRTQGAPARGALKGSTSVRFSDHLEGEAQEVLDKACKPGLEGLIGKHADSVYAAGRTKTWIKLKCRQRQDFVIAGYTAPGGSRTGFGALLLGLLRPRGASCATPARSAPASTSICCDALTKKLATLKRSDSPLVDPPREKGITWVKPQLVARDRLRRAHRRRHPAPGFVHGAARGHPAEVGRRGADAPSSSVKEVRARPDQRNAKTWCTA